VATRKLNDEGRENWGDFELAIAGTTHIGRIRKDNQDAFDRFDDDERGEILLVVADGMGGHQGGEIASRMAIGTLGKLCREGDGDPPTRLTHAIERANFEIHKLASKDRTLEGMGTTVVALLLCENGPSYVAHVGDSRLYRLRNEEFEPLTEDHSVVALLIRNGSISPEEARDHPKKNQIMRALGVWNETEVDIAPLDIEPGDAFLLCSDGLYGMLPDADLKVLAAGSPDPHSVVAWMIDAANQAGGMDNITAMIARIHDPISESAGAASDE
jgi:serine/threonine protein phosphatase PrpC